MAQVRARLSGISKVFDSGNGRVHALGPLDLDLAAGEFVTIVGPSGCGKTTLLETLAGLTAPTDGTVSFEGKPVGDEVPAGVAADEIRARVTYAIAFMGLQAFARAYPAQLSGGMRQRVCIARTLVLQPRLILLDEPFGALDQQTRLLMGDELLRLWRETHATVLLITHAIDEAVMLADRVGVMSARPGRFIELIETGWPASRSSAIVAEETFGKLTAHVWSKLRGESLRALGRAESEPAGISP